MKIEVYNDDFWLTLDKLVAECALVIDRPRGSSHPRYPSFIYLLDYGYLEESRSGDGGGIDVWVGSLPDSTATAVILCIDTEKRDAEVKVLLDCTPEEAQEILSIHNSGGQAGILVERGGV
ncbi:MAG TPA: inorganic pyrophosphatase [Chloroflexia bacterium]|nr:inorganic pyrophosphatase [Chloroflexia bacterium]